MFGIASLPSPDGRIIVFGGEVDPSTQGHAGAGLYTDATMVLDTQVSCFTQIFDQRSEQALGCHMPFVGILHAHSGTFVKRLLNTSSRLEISPTIAGWTESQKAW